MVWLTLVEVESIIQMSNWACSDMAEARLVFSAASTRTPGSGKALPRMVLVAFLKGLSRLQKSEARDVPSNPER